MHETRKRFNDGYLHPVNILMCPFTCVTNLPKPREHRPGMLSARVSVADFREISWFEFQIAVRELAALPLQLASVRNSKGKVNVSNSSIWR